MIEHLPIELRDRFTEMREIDLGVENTVDSLQDRQKTFFSNAASMTTTEREEQYNNIRKDYMKVIEESKEKIQIAEESYGLVDRYLRKLDQELHKFQLELEADNRGITEILEKRSLELDAPASRPSSFLKENRAPKKLKTQLHNTTIAHGSGSTSERAIRVGGSSSITGASSCGGSGGPVYSLDQIGASSSALAHAATQAIAATSQLAPGRRSSSLKASYEAINLGVANTEFSIGKELATAANSALAATSTDLSQVSSGSQQAAVNQNRMKNKLKLPKSSSSGASISLSLDMGGSVGGSFLDDMGPSDPTVLPIGDLATPSPIPAMSPSTSLTPGQGQGGGSGEEWNYDPNEPRYCICNQVSYGDMVGCDNEDCPYEWFHYPCVGITAPPKGKWYCQPCLASMRRRGRK